MSKKSFLTSLLMVLGLIITYSIPALAGGKDKSAKKAFTISGDVSGMPESMLVLEQLRANDSLKIVDSQKSTSTGHFAITGSQSEPGLYRLRFAPNKFVLLCVDKGDIKLTGSWPLEDYKFEGSTGSTELKLFVDTVYRIHDTNESNCSQN
jgi:hypothetical protein